VTSVMCPRRTLDSAKRKRKARRGKGACPWNPWENTWPASAENQTSARCLRSESGWPVLFRDDNSTRNDIEKIVERFVASLDAHERYCLVTVRRWHIRPTRLCIIFTRVPWRTRYVSPVLTVTQPGLSRSPDCYLRGYVRKDKVLRELLPPKKKKILTRNRRTGLPKQ